MIDNFHNNGMVMYINSKNLSIEKASYKLKTSMYVPLNMNNKQNSIYIDSLFRVKISNSINKHIGFGIISIMQVSKDLDYKTIGKTIENKYDSLIKRLK